MLKITEKELDRKLELFNHGKGYMKMTPEEKIAIKIWFTEEFDVEVIEQMYVFYKIFSDGENEEVRRVYFGEFILVTDRAKASFYEKGSDKYKKLSSQGWISEEV